MAVEMQLYSRFYTEIRCSASFFQFLVRIFTSVGIPQSNSRARISIYYFIMGLVGCLGEISFTAV
jgi:hypothetical protein